MNNSKIPIKTSLTIGKKPIKFTKVTPEEINKKRNQTYKYKY